jgi:hypothetical protein
MNHQANKDVCLKEVNFKIFIKLKLFQHIILYKNALLMRAHKMFSTDKLIVKNSLYYILEIVLLKFQKPDLLN